MRGRQGEGDVDYFKVTVSGPPQLWELDATGTSVAGIHWYRQDGTDLASGETSPDGGSARLEDMYFVPGDHWVRIDAAGDYSLTLKPLGPPDPNGEREPNDSPTDAEPLALDSPLRSVSVTGLALGTNSLTVLG